jgi:mRNA interferase RelE/StbE
VAEYKLFIKPSAAKEIEAIPHKKDRQRIIERIHGLATTPRPPDSKKLAGHDRYRLRQGNYRIIYSIDDTILIITVIKVGHRKNVYRGKL